MNDIAKLEFHIEVSKETLLAAILEMKDELRDLRADLEKLKRPLDFAKVVEKYVRT